MLKKRNIYFIGPMGSGKSTIGRQLAKQLQMEFFDSDQEIEQRTGVDISWVFDVEGEDKFREREEKIINELTSKQGIVLATGGGSIQSKRTRNRLSSRGFVVYLKTSITRQLLRTQHDKKRPLIYNKDDPYVVLEKLSIERNPLYQEIADMTISTDDQNTRIIVNKICDILKFNHDLNYVI